MGLRTGYAVRHQAGLRFHRRALHRPALVFSPQLAHGPPPPPRTGRLGTLLGWTPGPRLVTVPTANSRVSRCTTCGSPTPWRKQSHIYNNGSMNILAFWFRWLNLNKTSFSPSYSDNSQLTTQLIYNMPPLPPPPPPSIMVARAAASSMPSRTATRVHFAMRLCWPSTIPLKILSVVSCSSGP